MRRIIGAAAVVAAVAVCGCGGAGGDTGPAAPAKRADAVRVSGVPQNVPQLSARQAAHRLGLVTDDHGLTWTDKASGCEVSLVIVGGPGYAGTVTTDDPLVASADGRIGVTLGGVPADQERCAGVLSPRVSRLAGQV